ncbi:tyrosine-type recombinase/integrase [Streptomyces sp. IBSNAI002]|uniref:tyrosine-type recombinase/integrase n=1 Tax=Streptomyces sp. IBSNAI002 TaxID=3457500 RepID=UPI003FD344CC
MPEPSLVPAAAGPPPELVAQWAARHGVEVAERMLQAEGFADAVRQQTTPENTTKTYAKALTVWLRFCEEQRLPDCEPTRGTLVTYAAWLLHSGRKTPARDGTRGYAPASAETHLAATIAMLRREHACAIPKDDAAEAFAALKGLMTDLVKARERRGRGQAPAAEAAELRTAALATEDSLTGVRDRALLLVGFAVASRASELASLVQADVTVQSRGLKVNILTGKTVHSVRGAAIPYAKDPEVCPVLAWMAWRERLTAETGDRFTSPTDPAFHAIDRWGNVGGAMAPAAVTDAIGRIGKRAGVPLRWTGHSLRAGLATEARRNGADAITIAAQGGWAPHSRAMHGYMRRADEWTDNATAGLL